MAIDTPNVLREHNSTLKDHETRLIKVETTQCEHIKTHESIDKKLASHDTQISAVVVSMAKIETQSKNTNKILFYIATMITGYVFKYFFDLLVK